MKFSHYLERLHKSTEYKKFKQENPDSFLCAGFFVLDFETGKNTHQIDYFMSKKNKIATFYLDEGIHVKISDTVKRDKNNKAYKPQELKSNVKTDLEMLKGIVEDEMHNRTITQKLNKIIAILQTVKGKNIWYLNCITQNFGILKVHVNDADSSILEFEKLSLFDVIRR